MSYNPDYEIDSKAHGGHVENPYDGDDVKNVGAIPTQAQVHRMSPEERAMALRNAQIADPGLAVFSKRSFYFTCIVLVTCMCSGDNGEYQGFR